MATPLRVLFCIGRNQNFYDLPQGRIPEVGAGFAAFVAGLGGLDGVTVLGTLEDNQHMVGPSNSWPWTGYILADVADQPTVASACKLVETVQVGEHGLWRYATIEARIGQPIDVPA